MLNFLAKMIGVKGKEVSTFTRGENNKLALSQAGLRTGMWVALEEPAGSGTAIGIVTGCSLDGVAQVRIANERGENREDFARPKRVEDLRQAFIEEIPMRQGIIPPESLRALGYTNRSEA